MFSKKKSLVSVGAAVLGTALLVSGCSTTATNSPTESPSASISSSAPHKTPKPNKSNNPGSGKISLAPDTTALVVLDKIPVKGRAPKTGYTREQYGTAWKDVDQNSCDTRNDILNRDLTNKTYKDGAKQCVLATGTLVTDPYTGKTIEWVRGVDTSSTIQIDHIVALSNAWQTGASYWTELKRESFANDPINLIAADGPANMQKSDSDAASWLPANKAYRCKYVADQVAVKAKYGLWVTDSEKAAMKTVLNDCPNAPLASGGLPVPN